MFEQDFYLVGFSDQTVFSLFISVIVWKCRLPVRPHDVNTREFDLLIYCLGGHRVKVRNKENKWGIKAVESGGKKKQITFFIKSASTLCYKNAIISG